MNRIHIVGRKNHGKTTLVVDLVREFCRRGIRVGTVKHSRHVHDLDAPGKDSHRHRAAGGQPAAIITGDSVGVFLSRDGRSEYERLEPLFADCQIVLVEGDIDAPAGVKIEVWRAEKGTACLADERTDIAAIVSDDMVSDDMGIDNMASDSRPDVAVPVWPRRDVTGLADRIWHLAACGAATA